MDRTGILVESTGEPLCILLKDIIPSELIDLLEASASKVKNLGKVIEDMREHYRVVFLGHQIERGGSGEIHASKDILSEEGKIFMKENKALWELVSSLYQACFPHLAAFMDNTPEEYRAFGYFTSLFWNRSAISKDHVDDRD